MSAPSPTPSEARQPKAERRGTRERLRGVGMLAGSAVFIVFAVLNLGQVKVNWIVGSGHAPLIIVIVISTLVGVVLMYSGERLTRKRRGG
jgi:uncharacterized integral membrane protein